MAKKQPDSAALTPIAIKQWLSEHPCNESLVSTLLKDITTYVAGHYPRHTPAFNQWYVGISNDPDVARTKGHRHRKNLSELLHYKKFYAYSMSNARTVEQRLCEKWGLENCQVMGGIRPTSRWVYVYNLVKSSSSLKAGPKTL